ncbi:MAG: hypothetical protein ACYC63_04740 [Armatimonadota bacterium]
MSIAENGKMIVFVGKANTRRPVEVEVGGLATELQGVHWTGVRDRGLLGELLTEFDGNASIMSQVMGWGESSQLHTAVASARRSNTLTEHYPAPDAAVPEKKLTAGLTEKVRKYLHRLQRQASFEELSDHFDRSPRTIREAILEIQAAGIPVEMAADQSLITIPSVANPFREGELPGWGTHTIRFCAISDTHYENLCCARDEIEAVYSRCVDEGITDIIHAGNLSDGPGERGFRGHYQEVQSGCQTAYECLEFISANYPSRPGVTTHLLGSSTCHEGWEFKASGLDMGYALANGCVYGTLGREAEIRNVIPPRPDINYLGMDNYTITCGPEENTRIRVLHPGGGSSYASSYKSQKWVEALQGGTKPHFAIMGHYHKSHYFTPRDVRVLNPGCLEWQSPFMQKLGLAAEVAAWFVELTVDAGGSLRRVKLEEMPFYFEPKRHYHMNAGVPALGF